MSRFINKIQKIGIGRVEEGVASKIGNRIRSAYSGLVHSSSYIPDKWAIAWGTYANDLAKEVVDYVHMKKGDASVGELIGIVDGKSSKSGSPKSGVKGGEGVESVSVDYDHYIERCKSLIDELYVMRNRAVARLEKSGFENVEFNSKNDVSALHKILSDSFVPDYGRSASPKKPDGKISDVWDMIGRFRTEFKGGWTVVKRIVQLMFDNAVRVSKKDGHVADPKKVAQDAMQGVGATNAARMSANS